MLVKCESPDVFFQKRRVFTMQNASKEAPGSEMALDGPERLQNGPRIAQNGPRIAQNGPDAGQMCFRKLFEAHLRISGYCWTNGSQEASGGSF